MELDARFVLILSVSLAVALMIFAMGYRTGRLRHGRASHVVFLPAGQPIPVDSDAYERIAAAQEPAEATKRSKRFRWVFLGTALGTFLQFGLLILLGVAPKFCEFRGWKPPGAIEAPAAEVERPLPLELPPRPERQQEGGS